MGAVKRKSRRATAKDAVVCSSSDKIKIYTPPGIWSGYPAVGAIEMISDYVGKCNRDIKELFHEVFKRIRKQLFLLFK
jgi:hypothetical protein